jgi:cation:H+ antiporter
VVAGFRAQRDIAIGNVVGSNMYNMLGVLGLTAIMAPEGMPIAPAALRFDIPVMFAASLACLPILFSGGRISRGEGILFLGYYLAYAVFLVLTALQHGSLGIYTFAMFWFVIPLSAVGILSGVVLHIRQQRNHIPPAD